MNILPTCMLLSKYCYCTYLSFRSYFYFEIIKCRMVLNAPRSTNGLFLYDLQEVKFSQTKQKAATGPNLLERSKLLESPGGMRKVFLRSGLNVLSAHGKHSSLLVKMLGSRCLSTKINSIILLLSAKSRTVRIRRPRTPSIRRCLLQCLTTPKITPQEGCATLTVNWNVMPSLAQR